MKTSLQVIILILVISPSAWAVDPPPDGGYPNYNTAEGAGALYYLGAGADNTALGYSALYEAGDANSNTALGCLAFYTYGWDYSPPETTAVGAFTLFAPDFRSNTAIGANTCDDDTEFAGDAVTAIGASALHRIDWYGDTVIGFGTNATFFPYTSTSNGALAYSYDSFGVATGTYVSGGGTAMGAFATSGYHTIGSTGIGSQALAYGGGNSSDTAVGNDALKSESSIGGANIALGNAAGALITNGTNDITIGHPGVATESNAIRIGTVGTQTKAYIAAINGITVSAGVGVIVDTNGHLGTTTSSGRFKEKIKPMAKASETILSLQPVTFRYKHELDPDGSPQFGLIAEEVEKIDSRLVTHDDSGKTYTVRYEAVNAMLLNEFLKEHGTLQQQAHQLRRSAAALARLKAADNREEEEVAHLDTALARGQEEIDALTKKFQAATKAQAR